MDDFWEQRREGKMVFAGASLVLRVVSCLVPSLLPCVVCYVLHALVQVEEDEVRAEPSNCDG